MSHITKAKSEITRRNLLKAGGALTAVGVVTSPLSRTAAAAQTPTPTSFQEAPALAARVQSSELPPVAERLPATPLVVQPLESIGQYGGDWRSNFNGDFGTFIRQLGYEGLVRWKREVTAYSPDEVIPNVADSVEVGDNGATYTFTLRQGIKWSDGEPFTSADVLYWYEYDCLNTELNPTPPGYMVIDDQVATVEVPDDLTVVFRFAGPNGLFLQTIASGGNGLGMTGQPRHYMTQFHKDLTPEAEQAATEAGQASWVDFYRNRGDTWNNVERPVLDAWQLTTAVGESTDQLVAERNPYYWKVDTDGNQLPYLDRVVFSLIDDANTLSLRALNGELDTYEVANAERSLFFDNQERGNFRLLERYRPGGNQLPLSFNLTHKNPALRELFNSKDFRIGVSHAINRQEIIDVVYITLGQPYQVAPPEESTFYNEQLATQYTEYSPEQANAALDRIVPQMNADGIRLLSTGDPVQFLISPLGRNEDWIDGLNLIQRHLREVGIQVEVRPVDDALWRERVDSNDHDCVVWDGSAANDLLLSPSAYVPTGDIAYAKPWAIYYDVGPDAEGAEEPPEAAAEQQRLYSQIRSTADAGEQVALMQEIIANAAENFWTVGTTAPAPFVAAVRNDFRNVPERMVVTWTWPTPAPSDTSQYFRQQ